MHGWCMYGLVTNVNQHVLKSSFYNLYTLFQDIESVGDRILYAKFQNLERVGNRFLFKAKQINAIGIFKSVGDRILYAKIQNLERVGNRA